MMCSYNKLIIIAIVAAGVQFANGQQSKPVINEVVSSNVNGIPDEYEADLQNCPVPDCEQWYKDLGESIYDGEYPDWIEIYNPGNSKIDLTGYGLSDDPSNPYKWIFPNVSIDPDGFVFVFASGKDKYETYLHTNFKIDRLGEPIILTDNNGVTCDEFSGAEIPVDMSMGRYPDGDTSIVIFIEPTPNSSNSTTIFPGFTDQVSFSQAGGFYSGGISLSLSSNDGSAEIRYTDDGSEPTLNSSLYNSPIQINQTKVIRARTFKEGIISSIITTQTFFINENFTMPVVSLSTNAENLWDEDLGIYVPGKNANEAGRVANYWNDWERPVHVELFEPDGIKGFSIDAGVQIFGWGTRSNAQKSFSIMMRDRYGFPELNYQLFPDNSLDKFTSFVLRAGGSDWNKLFFRDAFARSLIAGHNLDLQDFRPAIVFINGEYWGIQNIREKQNEDYLESYWGIDKDNVDIISRYWRRNYPVIIEGDDFAFLEMENFLSANNMSVPSNYEYAKSLIDIDNLLDYLVSQIYFGNYDWPGNNNKNWRERIPNARWRWLMFDMDWTFSYDGNSSYSFNTLEHATNPFGFGWPNPAFTTLIFRRLFENKEFQNDFVNRMADFINTNFAEDFAQSKLNEMENLFRPEMPAHIQRWAPEGGIPSMSSWENELEKVEEFIEKRQTFIRGYLSDKFDLSGTDELMLNVNLTNAGRIKVNTIIVDSFPWEGIYFKDVAIKISVLPNQGYRFVKWSGVDPSQQSESSLSIILNDELNLTATFESDIGSLNTIVINEINYNSPAQYDPGDWIEIYNGFTIPIDVNGWKFKDLNPDNVFTIPPSVFIKPNKYLVICNDTASFKLKFPGVKNFIGNINFSLSNGGEHIQLLDDQNEIVDSLTYDDVDPWPSQPDGTGPTLALTNPFSDNSLPGNWQPSIVDFGTPGGPNDQPLSADAPDNSIPKEFVLYANYPNPFNPSTRIKFVIPPVPSGKSSFISLIVYDVLGREVTTLVNEEKKPGFYEVVWDASDQSSGIYFYRITSNVFSQTKKMILLK
jgi:hypothetical protein